MSSRNTDIVRADAYFAFSPLRVATMVLRYWYLLKGSWPRILELAYWPTMPRQRLHCHAWVTPQNKLMFY